MRSPHNVALGRFDEPVKKTMEIARETRMAKRVWERDARLWTGKDEDLWLGWLDIITEQKKEVPHLLEAAEDIKGAGFTDVLLLGMGGSSLCAEVIRLTFGRVDGYPELHVLDSTVPAQVKRFEGRVDLKNTLCIIASKSGGTTEPNVFRDYFYRRIQELVGPDEVGKHFVAITDPGSMVETDARERGFRYIFHGVPSIGGRYSALSNFGMAPAAIMGIDIEVLLDRAELMVQRCAACVEPAENPGLALGITLAALAKSGVDKVTFVTSPGIGDLGAWLEQLLAESTGKSDKGLIPIDLEPIGHADVYGPDRVFVYIRLMPEPDTDQDRTIDTLEMDGHPIVRISVPGKIDIGCEFFRWEFATAVAGAVLNINPFNQPNVQESKDYTKSLMDEYERIGSLPTESPVLETAGIKVYTDQANALALETWISGGTLESCLRGHMNRIELKDYVAINAYLEMNPENHELLQQIRQVIQNHKKIATTLGYGPRFLHSTGQLHKGGPNTGVFIQITSDDTEDLAIPGREYTFSVLKEAQSTGDHLSLSTRKRRILRIHLSTDVTAGLVKLHDAFENAMTN